MKIKQIIAITSLALIEICAIPIIFDIHGRKFEADQVAQAEPNDVARPIHPIEPARPASPKPQEVNPQPQANQLVESEFDRALEIIKNDPSKLEMLKSFQIIIKLLDTEIAQLSTIKRQFEISNGDPNGKAIAISMIQNIINDAERIKIRGVILISVGKEKEIGKLYKSHGEMVQNLADMFQIAKDMSQ